MSPSFILIMMALATSTANDNVLSEHELKSLIRSSVNELCPLGNVCHNEATDPIDFRKEERPCCTSCSCRDDCHLNGNCCFLNRTVGDVRALQKCLMPATNLIGKVYRDYWFVTECPTPAEQINHQTEETESHRSCGEHVVAPWGSFYPVYSKASRLLYKNSKCAECHGVKDGIQWVPELQCFAEYNTVSSVFKSKSIEGPCRVVFNFPGDGNDIQHLQCFPYTLRTCRDNGVSTVRNIEQENIIRMCESDFFAPFISTMAVYANVYCYLCNGFLKYKLFCPTDSGDRTKDMPLISLLTQDFIHELNGDGGDLRRYPVACFKKDGNNCRPLFCPNGQFHLKNGDCKQITESWDVEYVTFVVKIAPQKHIDWVKIESFIDIQLDLNTAGYIDSLKDDSTQVNTFVITGDGGFLQMPLSASFEVERIYMDTVVDDPVMFQNNHFVAKLRMRQNITNAAKLLQNLSLWLDKTWAIQIENTTTTAYQSLYPFEFPFVSAHSNPSLEVPTYTLLYNYNVTNMTNVHTPALQLFYKQDSLNKGTKIWYINNKLSFCNHVRLLSDEYRLTASNNVLFLKRQARFLFNSEFLILNDNGDSNVHVCAEDVDMIRSGCCDINCNVFSKITLGVFIYGLYEALQECLL